MNGYEIEELEVGRNFIELTVTNCDGHEVELKFFQMPVDLVKKTLDVYGVTLSEEELLSYD